MKEKISNLINESKSILLLTHESPDGDAIGSVLAFYHYLTSINKSVDMVILDIPKVFDFLPSIDKVVDNVVDNYDLGIVLDCASRERIGSKDDLFSKCKNTISIDHHISNGNYCDVNYVLGNISSCSQVIYYLFKDLNVNISKEIGVSLISGMLTDTNGFSINSVDSDTYKMAYELTNLGINIHSIYNKLLLVKTMPQYNLMKIAMERLEFFCDNRIAYTYILKDDFTNTGAVAGEHEGIVDIGRNIDGVEISIFLREDNGWTISLRSSGNYPVNEIAAKFNGGGHFMAAGGKVDGNLHEVKAKIIDECIKVLSNK